MKKIPEKFLPIGTVVMLKGATKRLMIAGFCAFENGEEEKEERKIWDYSGCLYPEGFLQSNQTCLFDHEQIAEIYHLASFAAPVKNCVVASSHAANGIIAGREDSYLIPEEITVECYE